MQQNTPKILIISSDTGGGHRSAAQALAVGVQRFWTGKSAAVRIMKAVEESHHITEKLVNVYNWLLQNKPALDEVSLSGSINRIRPETREFFHKRCIGYVKDQFEKWCPHVVVTVHPLTQHIFGRILRELNLQHQIPLVTVVTDPCYGFWKGWACDDVSLYLVANEDARRSADRLWCRTREDQDLRPAASSEILRGYRDGRSGCTPRLSASTRTSSPFSSTPAGSAAETFRRYSKSSSAASSTFRLYFSPARMKSSGSEAEELAKTAKFPVKVIGYSDEIEKLMQSANVMISKLGGLTTFEAFACRLPIIADATTKPMPQEAGTVNLISQNVVRALCSNTSKTSSRPSVHSCSIKTRYDAMRAATGGLSDAQFDRGYHPRDRSFFFRRQQPAAAAVGTCRQQP